MEMSSQNRTADRQPIAAGSFYPADQQTLTKEIASLFASCNEAPALTGVRALIAPHAGYIYSGKIAAAALSATSPDASFSNIFLIGSSHVMAFDGASVYNTGDFITPLGNASVNKEIANKLKNENKVFNFPVNAHLQEHSLEVQVPLIQYYFKETPRLVPIVIGTTDLKTIRAIADALKPWFTDENLFIISSDFSHYPNYKDAVEIDTKTAEAIITGNPSTFLATLRDNESENVPGLLTSMCGWTSGLLLLEMIKGNEELEIKKIDYANSGDTPYGDKTRVVGYNALAVVEKRNVKGPVKHEELKITGKEKDNLFSIARNSIRSKLYEDKTYLVDEKNVTGNLRNAYGAFVTLKINGELRGCIGRFVSADPLFKVVEVSALSSAFDDPRFAPISKEEFDKLEFEITVLGPMKRINNINEIVLGKHGIYIKKDYRAGTMLPQVAIENKWTVEQFLGYTARDKAGIGWDGWKDAELYIYEGLVLEEN